MNISENLTRIKQGKDDIIKSLQNKGSDISNDTLINEISTYVDKLEIGGGDTPSVPTELVQKYEGASVFRIVVPNDNYEFAINLCNNASTATYDVDWGDGVLESGLTTDEQHHTYSKKGVYDVNVYNLSKDITLGGQFQIRYNSNTNQGILIRFIFNNTNNDYWNGKYNLYEDNNCIHILLGKKITSIGTYAFYGCTSLTSIEIPSSVTSIGRYAFQNCSNLTSIEIPSSVTSIGNNVFKDCTSLTSIEIPSSVTSISDSAFYGCTSLTSIEIPSSVTSIGTSAFYGCTSLTSIEIQSSVTSIGTYAFYGCTSLTSIEIPSSVTSIGMSAFYGCTSLTSIEIPSSVTSIGTYAFAVCTSLTSIEIPSSVTSIGTYAFEGCTSLTSIEIPSSVTSIGNNVFKDCTSLTSIEIPSSVTSIGTSAFKGCTSLTSIEIPSSVTSIGESAFRGCSLIQNLVIPSSVTSIGNYAFESSICLQSITCETTVAPTIQSSSFNINKSNLLYTKRYLYVPKKSTGYNEGNWKTYLIDEGWELRYIEDRVKTPTTLKLKTKDNFFNNLQAIGQANLIDYELVDDEYIYYFDDKITELIENIFYNDSVVEITLPKGIEHIDKYGISYFNNLTKITCLDLIAPTLESLSGYGNNIGSNVPSGTKKVLRVPEGATGYDSGNWKTYVIDEGYTLEYIPLSEL